MDWFKGFALRLIYFTSILVVIGSAACAGENRPDPTAAGTRLPLDIGGEPPANLLPGATASPTLPMPSVVQEPAPAPPTAVSVLPPPGQPLPEPPAVGTKYTLDASLDYALHRLSVRQQIEYTHTAAEPIQTLVLVVEALRYPGCFQLGRIFDSAGDRVTSYRFEGTSLILPLAEKRSEGETLHFTIEYTLELLPLGGLASVRPYPLAYSDLQANFGDWYPFIPPYQPGTGWLVHPPAQFGEHLVYDLADFDVAITLEGAQTGLTIAGPTLPEESSPEASEETESIHFQHTAARNFAWSASPYYEVLTQTVPLENGHEVLAASYFFPFHREAGASLLQTLAESLQLYSRLYGSYPRQSLSAVQADFMDGMEYNGLFFLSTDFYNWHKDTPEDFLTALGAHETAHMWWMGLVGNDQALEPWLDEALCTYSEKLFFENVHPDALTWWWTWRVNYYEPSGPINISIYDPPNAVNEWRLYRDPVYLRGAQFMEALRQEIGDEAFFDALRMYAAQYAYKLADGEGFWEIVESQTDTDLSALKSEYFSP